MTRSPMTTQTQPHAETNGSGPRPTAAFHPGMDGTRVFDKRPILIYWETTLACDLACQHCRAEAQHEPHPYQLSTDEGIALLDELKTFGDPPPHLVMTGGDVMHRDDLFQLVEAAIDRGFPLSIAPSATNRLTREKLQRLKDLGVHGFSLSIDGSDAEWHDNFRGVPGTFEQTVWAAREIRGMGFPLQVNTLVTADTLPDLPNIYDLMLDLDVSRWSLFFLVQVGRGKVLKPITGAQAEKLFHWVYDTSKNSPFAIKTTEAMNFRRVAYQRMRIEGLSTEEIKQTSVGHGFGIRDGNGIMFISHTGDVYPTGFLPLSAGNVRQTSPVEIYRDSKLFIDLRNPDGFATDCGECEYRYICGGSRARAFAATGDPLAADPLCPYQPRGGEVVT